MGKQNILDDTATRASITRCVVEWCSTLTPSAQSHISGHDKSALAIGLIKDLTGAVASHEDLR